MAIGRIDLAEFPLQATASGCNNFDLLAEARFLTEMEAYLRLYIWKPLMTRK